MYSFFFSEEIAEACPIQCTCTEGTQFINCSNQNLLEIPIELPRNVIQIDLSYNNITALPLNAFINSTELRNIKLNKNSIETINKGVSNFNFFFLRLVF